MRVSWRSLTAGSSSREILPAAALAPDVEGPAVSPEVDGPDVAAGADVQGQSLLDNFPQGNISPE